MKDKQEKETITKNHEEHVDIVDRGGLFGEPACIK